jgi:hypothetical protein
MNEETNTPASHISIDVPSFVIIQNPSTEQEEIYYHCSYAYTTAKLFISRIQNKTFYFEKKPEETLTPLEDGQYAYHPGLPFFLVHEGELYILYSPKQDTSVHLQFFRIHTRNDGDRTLAPAVKLYHVSVGSLIYNDVFSDYHVLGELTDSPSPGATTCRMLDVTSKEIKEFTGSPNSFMLPHQVTYENTPIHNGHFITPHEHRDSDTIHVDDIIDVIMHRIAPEEVPLDHDLINSVDTLFYPHEYTAILELYKKLYHSHKMLRAIEDKADMFDCYVASGYHALRTVEQDLAYHTELLGHHCLVRFDKQKYKINPDLVLLEEPATGIICQVFSTSENCVRQLRQWDVSSYVPLSGDEPTNKILNGFKETSGLMPANRYGCKTLHKDLHPFLISLLARRFSDAVTSIHSLPHGVTQKEDTTAPDAAPLSSRKFTEYQYLLCEDAMVKLANANLQGLRIGDIEISFEYKMNEQSDSEIKNLHPKLLEEFKRISLDIEVVSDEKGVYDTISIMLLRDEYIIEEYKSYHLHWLATQSEHILSSFCIYLEQIKPLKDYASTFTNSAENLTQAILKRKE